MGVRGARFRARFEKGTSVLIDTAPLIYHLEDVEPWSDLTTMAFDLIANEEVNGFLSAVGIERILTNDVRLETYEPEGVDILLLSRFVV